MTDNLPQPDWRSECGNYVLYCGDCLEILPKLPAGCVDCVVTDPPYNIKHVDGGGFAAVSRFYAGGALDGLDSFDLALYAASLAGSSDQIVAFHSRDQISDWGQFCRASFGNYDLHVWHKTNAISFTCNTWKSDIEYIALGWRKKHHEIVKQHMKSKAWVSPRCTDAHHPTCKPIPLMEKYVGILVPPHGIVCDPFAGSGTTGVACVRLGRKFIGIELDRGYFEIACKRIEQAILDHNGGPMFAGIEDAPKLFDGEPTR